MRNSQHKEIQILLKFVNCLYDSYSNVARGDLDKCLLLSAIKHAIDKLNVCAYQSEMNSKLSFFKKLSEIEHEGGTIPIISTSLVSSREDDEELDWIIALLKKGFYYVQAMGNDGADIANSNSVSTSAFGTLKLLRKLNSDANENLEQVLLVSGYTTQTEINQSKMKNTKLVGKDNNALISCFNFMDASSPPYGKFFAKTRSVLYAPALTFSYTTPEEDQSRKKYELGSSMSTPLVAGALANLMAIGLPPKEAIRILRETAAMRPVKIAKYYQGKVVFDENCNTIFDKTFRLPILNFAAAVNAGEAWLLTNYKQ